MTKDSNVAKAEIYARAAEVLRPKQETKGTSRESVRNSAHIEEAAKPAE